MKPKKKMIGLKILLSLICGGLISEVIHISTGDPNRPRSTNFTLIYALVIYVVLTFVFNRENKSEQ